MFIYMVDIKSQVFTYKKKVYSQVFTFLWLMQFGCFGFAEVALVAWQINTAQMVWGFPMKS